MNRRYVTVDLISSAHQVVKAKLRSDRARRSSTRRESLMDEREHNYNNHRTHHLSGWLNACHAPRHAKRQTLLNLLLTDLQRAELISIVKVQQQTPTLLRFLLRALYTERWR